MPVDPISTAYGVQAGNNTGKSAPTLDYNAFLQLLIAEMKHQDPTEPMKSSEYVAQLAGFSNVEQSMQINQQLKLMMQASFLEQAGSIVGMTITSQNGLESGIVESVSILSDGLIATLQDGRQLAVGPGFTLSR